MTPDLRHYYLARITLEAATPLSIAAGGGDGVFDVALVCDANGLPALPGSAIAGVLRHLYWSLWGEEPMKALFGFQEKDDGQPSRLHVSWGGIQDSTGRPVEGLLLGPARERLRTDSLLAAAVANEYSPVHRDRVRIDHRGAAADTGKFDRAVLPAGYRFSAELSFWSHRPDDPLWRQVLDLMAHPLFRLGGGIRTGLGRIAMISARHAQFDLGTPDGRRRFSALGRALGDLEALHEVTATAGTDEDRRFVSAVLRLKPRGFWRIGQGDTPNKLDKSGKPADLLPKLEQRVAWDPESSRGQGAATQLLVPASSLKGAIAHRVAFHANRLARRWAEEQTDLSVWDKSEDCPEVQDIFGFARDDMSALSGEIAGQSGRLFIDDVFVPFGQGDLQLMMHNAIDRFTGGVREHMLFMEELVWKREISVPLTLDTKGVSDRARRALRHALDDLCGGRLAIGGGATKGHGFCDGTLEWSDGGAWIDAPEAKEVA